MSTEPTFQDLLATFSEEIFVGRTAQLALFEQLFTATRPPFLILAISGQGGVGKSTLLEQFSQIADRHHAHHALVNEDHKSVLDVLASFATQFQRAGHPCKTFDERYHKYRELKEQVEADPKAPKGFLDLAVRGATRIGLRTLRRVPIAGDAADVFLSPAAEDHLVDESSAIAAYLAQKFTNKDERLLLGESVKELTGHFLTDINNLAATRRVILFFDTYEQTAPYLDPWLRDLIAGKYGRFSAYITPIIAGRYPLGQPWTTFRRAIRQVELDPFTEEEAREYLERSGITDGGQIADFIKISDRLPVLLAMLTFAPGAVPTNLSADAVERFLQGMTKGEREIALLSAIPHHFNQDILAVLLGPEQADNAFAWLSKAHFVRQSQGGWRYHDIVRALLLRYTWVRSSAQCIQMHKQMATYYAAQLTQLGLDADLQRSNRQWRLFEIERLYHTVITQPATGLIDLIESLLSITLVDLERDVAYSELVYSVTQIAQIILQIYHEVNADALAPWANRVKQFVDEPLKFSQSIKAFFSDLLSLSALPQLSKHTIWLFIATSNIKNDDWQGAEQAATQAITLCENRPHSYRKRAFIYLALQHYSKALADCNKAIKLQPDDSINYFYRFFTYLLSGNYVAAIDDGTKAIELQPDAFRGYFIRSVAHCMMNNYVAAIDDGTKAIELQPDNDASYGWRGIIQFESGNYTATIADCTKAIELQPYNEEYYHVRGRAHAVIGNYVTAIDDLTKAIDLQPDNDENYHIRGVMYFLTRCYPEAIVDCTKVIALQPNKVSIYFIRGRAHLETGDYIAAMSDLNKAIEFYPNNGQYYHWRGRAHLETGDYIAAMSDLAKASELQPHNRENDLLRGITYLLNDDQMAVVTDITKAIEFQPDTAYNYFLRSFTHAKNGDYVAAIDDGTKAIELQPDNDASYGWRGIIQFESGNYTATIADCTKAIKLQPHNGEYYHVRGRAYLVTGDYATAISDFTKGIELHLGNEEINHWVSIMHLLTGRYVANLAKNSKFPPNLAERYRWRGIAHLLNADYAAAFSDLTHAIDLLPNDGDTYYWRGRAYQLTGDYAVALSDFTRAIELQAANGYNYHVRAHTYSAQQDYTAAIADFTRAIEFNPSNGYAYHWRGLLYRQVQDYQAALADLTQAVAFKDYPTLSHFWFAVIHLTLHQPEEAQTDLTKVEELLIPQLPGVPHNVINKALARLAKSAAGQAKLNEKWLTTIFKYLPTDQNVKRNIRWLITYLTDLPHNDDALLLRQHLQDFLNKEPLSAS